MALDAERTAELDGSATVAGARALIDRLGREGIALRALGGVAVAIRCDSARPGGVLARAHADMDFVLTREDATRIEMALSHLGFARPEFFRTAHGGSGMLFAGLDGPGVEIWIGEFDLCHRLPLARRLTIHEETLSLADLLLTKLQVAEINRPQDVTDTLALLLDHDLVAGESAINIDRVCRVLSRDYGWWLAATELLARLHELLPNTHLPDNAKRTIGARLQVLSHRVRTCRKSLRWHAHARLDNRRACRYAVAAVRRILALARPRSSDCGPRE
jgi:hypothetical protein